MEVTRPEALPQPRIVDYVCYREFLKAYYAFKNSLRAGFSYRRFATMFGMRSPNYLQLVIQGKRNLSVESAAVIARVLKFKAKEENYFLALVKKQSAKSDEEILQAEKEMFRAVKGIKAKFVDKNELGIFQEWYHFVVRELVFLPGFEPSADWIRERLNGMLTVKQAEASLEFLISSGFLKFDGGKYKAVDPVIDTGTELFKHQLLQGYHAKTLRLWSDQLQQGGLGGAKQELGLVNIPIPPDKIEELRKKIRFFQDEIIGWAQDFQGSEELVQLGTYLMILTERQK